MSTTPLTVITSCCMSDNFQTIYYNRKFFMLKDCSYKSLMTVYVKIYVKNFGIIFVDLKQMATVCYVSSQLLCMELIDIMMIWD